MRCKEAKKLFSAHLDGELPVGREEKFLAHLNACPGCSSLLRKVGDVITLLGHLPKHTLSGEESLDIRRAWRAQAGELRKHREPASVGRARAATALGAVMVLGAAAIISFSVLHHPQEMGENAATTETAVENDTGPDGARPYTSTIPLSTGTTVGDQVLPQVVSAARVVGAADMQSYQADLTQKQNFYSAVWQVSAEKAGTDPTPAYDLEALTALQTRCSDDMVEAAGSLGEDAGGLHTALTTVLAASTNQVPLLPCWAEKVLFDGKAAWIISLSGPDEGLLQTAGTGTPQAGEQPAGNEQGLTGNLDPHPASTRHLFVVDALDFQILFR